MYRNVIREVLIFPSEYHEACVVNMLMILRLLEGFLSPFLIFNSIFIKMKKIQFICAVVAIAMICIMFLVLTFTAVAGFVFQYDWTSGIDLGSCVAFAIAFLLAGRIFAPVVRNCYDEWKEGTR